MERLSLKGDTVYIHVRVASSYETSSCWRDLYMWIFELQNHALEDASTEVVLYVQIDMIG
jgi:hypothetical protein